VEDLVKNNKGIQILTDTGWSNFAGVLAKGKKETVLIQTTTKKITCTLDHDFFNVNLEKIPAKKLKPGTKIKDDAGVDTVVNITLHSAEQVYDLLNVEKNHRFYANGLLLSNCEFIIADETLINPSTLIDLEGIEPILRQGQIRWYKTPKKGNIYVVTLDPSIGTGGDNAGIQIFEANTTTQIGEWKHNKTDIPNQVKLIAQINKYIVDCTSEPRNLYYSVENNTVGEAALVSLNEYGEQNILGNFISEPGKKRKGFTTTNKSKLAACAKFKSLLESKKLIVHSKSLISELKTFVAKGSSYEAKLGEADDLIMASLLNVRVMQLLSEYNSDLDGHMRDHDEIVMPLPFFAVFA
jgi:hypothetical protein